MIEHLYVLFLQSVYFDQCFQFEYQYDFVIYFYPSDFDILRSILTDSNGYDM